MPTLSSVDGSVDCSSALGASISLLPAKYKKREKNKTKLEAVRRDYDCPPSAPCLVQECQEALNLLGYKNAQFQDLAMGSPELKTGRQTPPLN